MARASFFRCFAGLALVAALAGCRVETTRGAYGDPVGYGGIDGTWSFVNQNNDDVIVDVRGASDGVFVSARGGETVFYREVGSGVFTDPKGRTIEFLSDGDAIYRDNTVGRVFTMGRPGTGYAPSNYGDRSGFGTWGFINENNQEVIVDIRRDSNGISVAARGGETIFYRQVGREAFADPQGRVIEFYGGGEAVYRDPARGRVFQMSQF